MSETNKPEELTPEELLEKQKELLAKAGNTISKQASVIEEQKYMIRDLQAGVPSFGVILDFKDIDRREANPEPTSDEDKFKIITENFAVVATSGGVNEFAYLKYLKDDLKVGQYVALSPSGTIIRISDTDYMHGSVVNFIESTGKYTCVVEVNGEKRQAWKLPRKKFEEGDSVYMSAGGVVKEKAKLKAVAQKVSSTITTTWDDIGGIDDIRNEVREKIEDPIEFADIYEKYGRRRTKGILLHGPPGCGKTLIGKAVYTSLAGRYGQNAIDEGFAYIKGPEILNMYVGESEARIRAIFRRMRKFASTKGFPGVIFFDEAESLFAERGGRNTSFMSGTIVPTLLAELDGFDEETPITIFATNRPDILDSAVTRDGRCDVKLEVKRPDEDASKAIFRVHASKFPTCDDMEDLEEAFVGTFFDNSLRYLEVHFKDGTTKVIRLQDIVNGAMIAAVVDIAADRAIQRDKELRNVTGITANDIAIAVRHAYVSNVIKNVEPTVVTYLNEHNIQKQVTKVTQEKLNV